MDEFNFLYEYTSSSTLRGGDDIFDANHVEDFLGNAFERLDHPLFNAIGLIPKTDDIFEPAFKLYLKKIFRAGSDYRKLGTYYQIQGKGAYGTISFKNLKNISKASDVPNIFSNSYNDYMVHLEDIYFTRMGIGPDQFLKLKTISNKVKGRSQMHFFTETQLFENTYNPNFTPQNLFPKIHSDKPTYLLDKMNYADDYFIKNSTVEEKFKFKAGAISVKSSNPNELLPMELLHNIKIPRPFYDNGRYSGIAEVGRFSAVNSPEESLNLVKMAALELTRGGESLHSISKIYIEVDQVRKRLFKKFGFKEFKELSGTEYYTSGTDYIMVADMKDFLNLTLK